MAQHGEPLEARAEREADVLLRVEPEIAHHLRPMTEADLPRIHRIELASYEYPWSPGNFADSLSAGYSMWVREAEGLDLGDTVEVSLTVAA